MSYRRKHVKTKIHRIKPKKSILKKPFFWIGFLLLSTVLAACYLLFFYSKFQVNDVVISGGQKVQTDALKSLVLNNINKKISKSIFLVDAEKISKEVLDNFSIIGNIKISKKLPQTLNIEIKERVPIAVFCPSFTETVEENQGKCFLIDESGVVFEPLYATLQNMVIVRQLMDKNKVLSGQKVVEQNIMKAVSMIKKNLKENFKIDIKEAFITSPLQLNVVTNENWQAYFNLDQNSDINLQITKMDLLLKGEIAPEARKNLHYIDLRFKDRAYYK